MITVVDRLVEKIQKLALELEEAKRKIAELESLSQPKARRHPKKARRHLKLVIGGKGGAQ